MYSRKKRILCFILGICVLFFSYLISEDRDAHACDKRDVATPYSAEITFYSGAAANSEICTIEMLGIANTLSFVRCDRRSSNQSYIKLSQIPFLCVNLNPEISKSSTEQQTEEKITCSSYAVIVQYIHNQDGQK